MTTVRDSAAGSVLTKGPIDFPRVAAAQLLHHRTRVIGEGTRWSNKYRRVLAVSDVCVIISVTLIAQMARFGLDEVQVAVGWFNVGYFQISILIAVAWTVALGAYRTRDARIIGIGVDEYKRVVSATVALLGILAILCLLFQVDIARSYFALAFPLGVAGLIASRWALRRWLTRQRTKGHYLSQVLVLGKPKDVSYVVNQIEKKSGAAYHVVGVCLTGNPGMKWLNLGRRAVPVVQESWSIVDAVRELGADAVIVAGPSKGGGRYIQELGWQLEESSTELILTTGLTNVAGPRIHARPVEGLPLMHVELPQYTGARHTVKRLFDILASASALFLLLPVFLLLAILIKRDSPGRVLFLQERVGKGGKKFLMVKFRSMVESAEDDLAGLLDQNEGSGVLFKMQHDPRVTEVGRWMRKYSLDELPQFWNILKGDMSLVGPRPPLQREVDGYKNRVHRRLYIKPGLTGMWQTNGRSELNWQDSIRLDLYYVENWSLAGDLIIIWRTALQMIKPVGAC
ncbi:sugar transferase [Pseudarthrobacter sp. PvP090]|uniref:sugar transferase n=1 Tax=Pseudarthrobacter sp. PvP090 TaxID=3156393 RepID=UPI003394A229